ncbi:hypothetical protein MW887_004579 [Aspergillus wentii]|nr:hypothetical protein MW887_004579 [Aspergillus wentii]
MRRHRLAPIFGMIEDTESDPLKVAWRTIKEQTALPQSSLTVFRHGKNFISEDLSLGQKCVFYPFAFRLESQPDAGLNDGIHGSCKSSGWKWYDPKTVEWVKEFGGIPYLQEGLRKVWFEIDLGPISGRILAGGLRQLQHDHESGARKMAGVSLSVLQGVLENLDDPISLDGPWWQKARLAAWHLWKNGRQSMDAAILSFLLLALAEIETYLSTTSPDGASKSLRKAFDTVQKTMRSFTNRISSNLALHVRSKIRKSGQSPKIFRIMTLSASSTVRECVVQAALASGAPFVEIRVLESRPLFEGVSMASSILSCLKSKPDIPKVRVTIFTDASVAMAAKDVDMLVLAADRIAADGSVSNKTGSLPAALSTRHMSSSGEVVVVSEKHKVAMQTCDGEAHIVENNDSSEVMEAWEQNETVKGLETVQDSLDMDGSVCTIQQPTVDIQNVYFEWVPPTLIDAYICEDGVKVPSDFQKQSLWVKEQCERYFESDL